MKVRRQLRGADLITLRKNYLNTNKILIDENMNAVVIVMPDKGAQPC
jgi:hypothetical protein